MVTSKYRISIFRSYLFFEQIDDGGRIDIMLMVVFNTHHISRRECHVLVQGLSCEGEGEREKVGEGKEGGRKGIRWAEKGGPQH